MELPGPPSSLRRLSRALLSALRRLGLAPRQGCPPAAGTWGAWTGRPSAPTATFGIAGVQPVQEAVSPGRPAGRRAGGAAVTAGWPGWPRRATPCTCGTPGTRRRTRRRRTEPAGRAQLRARLPGLQHRGAGRAETAARAAPSAGARPGGRDADAVLAQAGEIGGYRRARRAGELGAVAAADLAWPHPAISSSAAQPAATGTSARRGRLRHDCGAAGRRVIPRSMEHLLTRPRPAGPCHVPRPMHDVKADHSEADQIVPTKDERKLGARCLFANARSDRGPPWPDARAPRRAV